MVAQVAFIGFSFVSPYIQPAPLLRITGRTTTSIAPYGQPPRRFCNQCNVPASHEQTLYTADSTIRADVSARCIFTLTETVAVEMFTPLMTWIRGKNVPGSAMHSPDFPDEKPRTPLQGTATNTFTRVSNDETVHQIPSNDS